MTGVRYPTGTGIFSLSALQGLLLVIKTPSTSQLIKRAIRQHYCSLHLEKRLISHARILALPTRIGDVRLNQVQQEVHSSSQNRQVNVGGDNLGFSGVKGNSYTATLCGGNIEFNQAVRLVTTTLQS